LELDQGYYSTKYCLHCGLLDKRRDAFKAVTLDGLTLINDAISRPRLSFQQ